MWLPCAQLGPRSAENRQQPHRCTSNKHKASVNFSHLNILKIVYASNISYTFSLKITFF